MARSNDIGHDLVVEDYKTDEISFLDLVQAVADNLRKLILLPLLIGLVALGISFLLPPMFVATAKFLPPQQQQSAASSMLLSLGSLGGLAGAASALKDPSDQYIAFLRTRVLQDALIDRFSLLERYDRETKQEARAALAARTKITSKDNIITVEFEDSDPTVAASIANAYVEELSKLLDRMAVGEAQQRRQFFEKQLEATKNSLIKAEQSLAASGISVQALNSSPSMALEGPARLRAQVTALEIRIASLRTFLTPSSPEFRQASAELAALRAQLANAERERPSSNTGTNDYIAKYREYKYQETLFELFSRLYETAKVDESKQGVVQVVDPAIPPERKAKPKKALIALLATVGSGFLLLMLVLTREIFRRSTDDVNGQRQRQKIRASVARAFGRSSSSY